MARSAEIPAVLDEEIASFLVDIGEIDRVKAGDARCLVCRDPLKLETIQLVVPAKGHVEYVCSNRSCLLQFATHEPDDEAA